MISGLVIAGAASGGAYAQPAQPDGPPSSPAAEVRYVALAKNSPWFRENRERVECGPIKDETLRAACVSSFGPRPLQLPPGFVAPPAVKQAKPWTAPKD
jgi:hypothetical protein